jgi:hypothetical protein
MSPDQRKTARARCEAIGPATADSAAENRADLMAALNALDAADEVIAEWKALIDALSERVHSQSEKLSRRAERRLPQ